MKCILSMLKYTIKEDNYHNSDIQSYSKVSPSETVSASTTALSDKANGANERPENCREGIIIFLEDADGATNAPTAVADARRRETAVESFIFQLRVILRLTRM